MAIKSSVDILFKEHSFEEIESVRDNLASEIEKRTELLKSIVKEKYRDVVETSDAIQSMKLNLNKLEQSIQHLDKSISNFYTNIEETKYDKRTIVKIQSSRNTLGTDCTNQSAFNVGAQNIDSREAPRKTNEDNKATGDTTIKQLLVMLTEIWDHFETGNLKMSVKLYNDSMNLLEKCRPSQRDEKETVLFQDIESDLRGTRQMIKNFLWYKIQSAEKNTIGIIASSDEKDLYTLSLETSIEFLVDKLRRDISDISYQAQIRRYQEYSYFNTTTNMIDTEMDDMKPPSTDHVQIPRTISIELSAFLFDTCRAINTIAGFSLNRRSILDSLRMSLNQILNVYTELVEIMDKLSGGSKRRRALQLYFDLMYIRVILNSSKDFELIEELDTKISELMSKFEVMLDTIELYMVSEALHSNVLQLSTSTIRLYGLLVPDIQ